MKTILYQPLFTNPQAYFVFPQLYHIEKGDSYIEPANITGQLIINNLSEGLTLTPTVNVIQDSNQVDFSLFKGKHIRISQYTNIGAVVLGEWYIPGTPEPEQPDWFKESIVAWYSPYCKQGLTNYDVIEAYTEDFTTWVYNQNAGVANITSNTITISESFTSQNIVEDTNSPYSDLSIYVTGITEDVYLFVKDMSGRVEEIRKNGLHTFKNNSRFFGFSVNKPAACNIVIKQLPTSILKDFSGNKHDAYLYGFKGKLNSGVGIYAQDFKNWSYGSTINTDISTKSYNKFHIVKKKADNWFGFTIGIPKNNYYNQSYKLKFNINKKIDDIKFSIVSTDAMSSSPDRLTWGNYETTEPLKFTDYITIHKGNIMSIEIYYKSDNIGCINSYILFFKKDKTTGQIYKTHILVTKELLRSANGFNNLLVEIPYVGCIGSKWEEFNDELLYKPDIRVKGTFAQKPVSSQGIYPGFSYFCTDKQTTEGSRNGIMIYYVGDDTWTDALGRYIH